MIFIKKYNIFVTMKYVDKKFSKYQESQRMGDYDIYNNKTHRQERREVKRLIKTFRIYEQIDKAYLECFNLHTQRFIIYKIVSGENINEIKKSYQAPKDVYRNNKIKELLK